MKRISDDPSAFAAQFDHLPEKETIPKKKKDVIRVGDRVRLIDPRFVKRVGYPKTKDDYAEVVAKLRTDVSALLDKVDRHHKLGFSETIERTKAHSQVEDALQYLALAADGYGGKDRQIYWQEVPEALGSLWEVIDMRTVITGTYSPAWGHTDYYGESDYYPASLENQTHHRLATVQHCYEPEYPVRYYSGGTMETAVYCLEKYTFTVPEENLDA